MYLRYRYGYKNRIRNPLESPDHKLQYCTYPEYPMELECICHEGRAEGTGRVEGATVGGQAGQVGQPDAQAWTQGVRRSEYVNE